MNKSILKISLIALAVGLSISTQAFAWKIVYDPSNFSKNSVTAVQQVQQTALQASIKATEIQHYLLMVQNLKQLNPAIISQGVSRGLIPAGNYSSPGQVAAAAQGVYGSYQQIGETMKAFNVSYGGIDTLMKDLDRTSINSHVSPEKILQYDFQHSQAGIQQDTNYYNTLQDLNGQLAQHQKRSDALAASIPAQSGTVELLQTLGAQNTVVQDQMSHLIQVSAITSAEVVQNSKDEKLKREQEARNKALGAQIETNSNKYFSK